MHPTKDDCYTFHGNVTIDGNVTVDGKVNTADHGVDPPYIVLDVETRTNIAQRVASEVAPDKQGGAALFFNQATKKVEVYVPADGTFYDLAGNVVDNLTLPAAQVTIGRRIWFDAGTGDVMTNQTVDAPRYQIRQGYQFDPADGQFYQISSGAGSNAVPRILVLKSQAITLTPVSSATSIMNTGTADAN